MSKNIFDSTPSSRVPRSKFDLSHDRKLSFGIGKIIPIMLQEALPGGSYRARHNVMLRVAPLATPAYTKMRVKVESFFVPLRIVYDGTETFFTGGEDGRQVDVMPYFEPSSLDSNYAVTRVGTLWDHLGLPTTAEGVEHAYVDKMTCLPFRAYQKIYNDWYRIPGINAEVEFSTGSGAVSDFGEIERLCTLRKCNWERDYFTSAQPEAQRGVSAAAPIDVVYRDQSLVFDSTNSSPLGAGSYLAIPTGSPPGQLRGTGSTAAAGVPARVDNISKASVLVEAIRLASSVQRFLEGMARGGSRYVEQLWQMFKVKSQDSRLQRPELLSTQRGTLTISEVLSSVQFEGATDDLPQGNMAGHGIHVGTLGGYQYRAPEHGYFITVMRVVPDGNHYGNGYNSGIEKLWKRLDKFDFYWKDLANLGEQAITTGELTSNIQLSNSVALQKVVFGYAPRYSEYKWKLSSVHGDFRTSLQAWHQNRGFTPTIDPLDLPHLNENFVSVDDTFDELNRIFAVEDGSDLLWCMVMHDVSAVLPMPYHSVPGGIV